VMFDCPSFAIFRLPSSVTIAASFDDAQVYL